MTQRASLGEHQLAHVHRQHGSCDQGSFFKAMLGSLRVPIANSTLNAHQENHLKIADWLAVSTSHIDPQRTFSTNAPSSEVRSLRRVTMRGPDLFEDLCDVLRIFTAEVLEGKRIGCIEVAAELDPVCRF